MTAAADIRANFGRNLTRLMHWAADANRGVLPAPVRRRAALVLADDLAAIVLASREPEVSKTIDQFARTSFAPEATVFKRNAARVDRFSAAASNGMAITWCELDEGFRKAPSHGGAYALPAIMAEAEHRDVTLSDLANALAISYEIAGRVSLAFKFDVMTVHPHAALATVGAAAGAALIRKANAEVLQAAVTNACAMTFAGPFNHAVEGALVRNAWTSAGAWIGMRSVDWAEAGISGLAQTPYDVFTTVFGAQCHADALVTDLGEDWAIANGYHKMFACCQYAHSAVEANLELVSRLDGAKLTLGEIAEITVETHKLGMNLTNVEPATTLAAKFSLPHAMAATSVMRTGGFDAFTRATLEQPEIAALRRRVTLKQHPAVQPWPKDRPARVTWLFTNGESWQAECDSAKGGADNPYGEDAIFGKLDKAMAADFPAMAPYLKALISAADADFRTPLRVAVSQMLEQTKNV
ncbi:MmgE/PrpD family protein [Bradyrhizobium sp. LHD-71]|uniref:MmgE/PrpD family protein n=1 Tax=Bradyrhizobium sp. LHD-71 TaxID=3072141 RepID=UPI00280D8E50|nr:MmgE/PrpD family protein [Bradyrhizobium sp. LHD-71]MDQ8727350.1 MmgE/PrpD family protein [Bradyrhizobium sp. LHD-71]